MNRAASRRWTKIVASLFLGAVLASGTGCSLNLGPFTSIAKGAYNLFAIMFNAGLGGTTSVTN